jgi:glycosyltransferase involved in cell wall biosynthesis
MIQGMNIIANFGGYGGYQILSERFIKAFTQAMPSDFILNILPNSEVGQSQDPVIAKYLWESTRGQTPFQDTSFGIIPFEKLLTFYGKKRILYPAHEGTVLPDHIVKFASELDAIWVSSKHSYEVFETAGLSPDKMFHFPCFIDVNAFSPLYNGQKNLPLHTPTRRVLLNNNPTPEDPITFLVIGKYENRKASLEHVKGFIDAANKHPLGDCIRLVTKWSTTVRSRSSDQIRQELTPLLYDNPKRANQIVAIQDRDVDLVQLYNKTDCLLMATRAEGNGLPLFEAMSCAIPVIVTPYTSFKDYISPDTNIILPDRGQVPANDPFYNLTPKNFGTWGEVTPEDISDAVCKFLDMSLIERRDLGLKGRESISKYNYEAAGKKALSYLEAIQ